MHPKKTRFTYSACEPFTKTKEGTQKFNIWYMYSTNNEGKFIIAERSIKS